MTDEVGPPLPTPQHIAAMCLKEMTDAHLGPTGQPCQVCGNDPEQRHRIWDTISERWHTNATLDELAAEYAEPDEDWPYGADAICAVMVGQAAWLLEEARQEALQVRGILAEIVRVECRPDFDGLTDSETLHPFPWEQPR